MQAISLATAMHPMLMQDDVPAEIIVVTVATAPSGEHFSVAEVEAEFPHKDANEVCWQPSGYNPSDPVGEKWVDYEDSTSEIMRAECATQDWLEVCQVKLDWQQINCDGRQEGEAKEMVKETSDEEESTGLPWWIVIPVQLLAWVWDMHVVLIITLPWWSILFAVALFDYLLDFTFWLLFGWYCSFCAGFFIWIINLVHLPFTIWGWFQRIFLEIFSFMIDGWMLFFGSGCFIWWGNDCRMMGWGMYWALDIPWYTSNDFGGESLVATINEKLTIPEIKEPMDFWTVREKSRAEFMSLIPVVGEIYSIVAKISQSIEL